MEDLQILKLKKKIKKNLYLKEDAFKSTVLYVTDAVTEANSNMRENK